MGITVNDMGGDVSLFQVSSNGCQAKGRHDIGHAGYIMTGGTRVVAKGMDQDYFGEIKSAHGIRCGSVADQQNRREQLSYCPGDLSFYLSS